MKLFQKNDFKGEYVSFQYVTDVRSRDFVVMSDENKVTQGLFKDDLLAGTIEFQYMLDEDHAVAN